MAHSAVVVLSREYLIDVIPVRLRQEDCRLISLLLVAGSCDLATRVVLVSAMISLKNDATSIYLHPGCPSSLDCLIFGSVVVHIFEKRLNRPSGIYMIVLSERLQCHVALCSILFGPIAVYSARGFRASFEFIGRSIIELL